MCMPTDSGSMLTRVVACVFGKLHRDVGVFEPDTTGQSRLGVQPPRVVKLIVFFIVRLGQRGAALTDIHMASCTRTDHLAGVFNRHAMLEQTFAQRGAA